MAGTTQVQQEIPVVGGELDAAYLRAALKRAGLPHSVESVEYTAFTDGRSGAVVGMLEAQISDSRGATGKNRWAHKAIRRDGWVTSALGRSVPSEVALWQSGAFANLPEPLSCPTLDIVYHEPRGEWWMLMEDVSAGIAPRGDFGEGNSRKLLRALAPFHARYWERDEELGRLPLSSLEATINFIAEPILTVAHGREPRGWVKKVIDDFFVLRIFLPIFLEVLSPQDADFYLAMIENRQEWHPALEQYPATFLHDDLRRANIAFLPDKVSLIDWELATRGPAAVDLQYHWFFQFWAYPPRDGKTVADREPLREEYLDHLDRALEGRLDRAGFEVVWDLAWLRLLSQLGFLLVDPLTSPSHTSEDIGRVKQICSRAIARARQVCDAHVG